MNCQRCGSLLEAGATFCKTCGAQVTSQPAVEIQQPVYQETVVETPQVIEPVEPIQIIEPTPVVNPEPVVEPNYQQSVQPEPVVAPVVEPVQPVYQETVVETPQVIEPVEPIEIIEPTPVVNPEPVVEPNYQQSVQPEPVVAPVVEPVQPVYQEPVVETQPVIEPVQQSYQQPTYSRPMSQQPVSGNYDNKGLKILSYLGVLVFIPMFSKAKDDPSVKFHIGQGLVCLISDIIVLLTDRLIIWNIFKEEIKVFGIGTHAYVLSGPGQLLRWALLIINAIFIVSGIRNAANGKDKEVPVIGKFAFYK